MNKAIFLILAIFLGASVMVPNPHWAWGLSLAKILLVAFVYMELRHAQILWQLGFTAFFLTLFGTLLLLV